MSTLSEIAIKIVKEQELIIGPVAWQEAEKVQGLEVISRKTGEIVLHSDDEKAVIDALVNQYEHFFGRAAREVCKEAVASLLADLNPSETPMSLA